MNRVLALVVVVAALAVFGCGGGSGGGNKAPQINSLTAAGAVWPGGATNITCDATDGDGDALTYTWTAVTGGTITPNGATATFTAPQTVGVGSYQVRCQVSDGKGGSDTATVQVTVGATVQGRAVSMLTGDPAPGVPMSVGGAIGVTDANGNFTISGVAQGTHRVDTSPETDYWVAGAVDVVVTTPGSTVQVVQAVEVHRGPPLPPNW